MKVRGAALAGLIAGVVAGCGSAVTLPAPNPGGYPVECAHGTDRCYQLGRRVAFVRGGVFAAGVEAACRRYGLQQFLPATGPNGDPTYAWTTIGDASDVPAPDGDTYTCLGSGQVP
jgi:hypothetical protein